MKEYMIMNIASVTVCSIAIATACVVSKSAWPLLAYLIVPRWTYNAKQEKSDGGQAE